MIICPECDSKLDAFHRFRIDSRRAQLEFATIIKSHYPLHYGNNHIEFYPPPMEAIRSSIDESMYINVENMYSSTPAPSTIQSTQEYEAQCAYHDLHSLMDDDNQNDHQSLVMSNTQELYVHQPHCSPLSPATPIYVQPPQVTPQTENCYQQPTEQPTPIVMESHYVVDPTQQNQQQQILEPPPPPPVQPVEEDLEHFPQEDNDSFTYSDYDEECQSVPSDRNNVENAIDKKIEEFIQNKGTKAPKICTVCNKLFRTNYKLRVHMEVHAERTKFICGSDGCGKSFKSKIGLKEHSGLHNADIYNFTCEVCSKKFVLKTYFVAHKRIHSNPNAKTFCCSLCPKTFNSKQNLIDHENAHLGMKFFKCEICPKAFNTKTHLDVHTRSHGNEVSVHCPVCNKFLKSKKYLKTHLKCHDDNLKQHICNICHKKFLQLSDLQKHGKIHTKEKDYICET